MLMTLSYVSDMLYFLIMCHCIILQVLVTLAIQAEVDDIADKWYSYRFGKALYIPNTRKDEFT